MRAIHPREPRAVMLRYTLLRLPPRGEKVGELSALWFDGERNLFGAVTQEVPSVEVKIKGDGSSVQLGDASLTTTEIRGAVTIPENNVSWKLTWEGHHPPLTLLPGKGYEALFPQAKGMVLTPFARFNGDLSVNGQPFLIQDWLGSINHRWGSKYLDAFAWGQVVGFDTHNDSFLEAATACLRWGPIRTPYVTPLVLRHRGEEFAFNTFFQLCDSRVLFRICLGIPGRNPRGKDRGNGICASERFVSLPYRTPLGEEKASLNTNLASCEVRFEDRRGATKVWETLFTRYRAAFEIAHDPLGNETPMSLRNVIDR